MLPYLCWREMELEDDDVTIMRPSSDGTKYPVSGKTYRLDCVDCGAKQLFFQKHGEINFTLISSTHVC